MEQNVEALSQRLAQLEQRQRAMYAALSAVVLLSFVFAVLVSRWTRPSGDVVTTRRVVIVDAAGAEVGRIEATREGTCAASGGGRLVVTTTDGRQAIIPPC